MLNAISEVCNGREPLWVIQFRPIVKIGCEVAIGACRNVPDISLIDFYIMMNLAGNQIVNMRKGERDNL